MTEEEPNFKGIKEAYSLIKKYIHTTPLLTCETLNEIASENSNQRNLFFKCENFQKVGAFKFRGNNECSLKSLGAANAVFSLSEDEAKKGVVTHSSGNFAQALSLAAKMRNIPAHIIMPSNSPLVKKNAVKNTYKGTVYECSPNVKDRETLCQKVQQETGATMCHPYNQTKIICGQGTISIELMEQIGKDEKYNFDSLLCPIGDFYFQLKFKEEVV
jgi:threonine dehydratase